jgi:hypothetical protein
VACAAHIMILLLLLSSDKCCLVGKFPGPNNVILRYHGIVVHSNESVINAI